jgi:hypothetical protein
VSICTESTRGPREPVLQVLVAARVFLGQRVNLQEKYDYPTKVDDTSVARRKYGLPDRFGSCHTAVVGGYVVEGHVPANDVKKLLAMKPVAVGLAVPGMPVGSPGMEMGSRKDPYQVLLVAKDGRERAFSNYN